MHNIWQNIQADQHPFGPNFKTQSDNVICTSQECSFHQDTVIEMWDVLDCPKFYKIVGLNNYSLFRGGNLSCFSFFIKTMHNTNPWVNSNICKCRHISPQLYLYWCELKTSSTKVKMYFPLQCLHCDHGQGQAETRLAIPVLWTFGAENHQRPQNVFGKCFINSTVSQHLNIKLKIIVWSTSRGHYEIAQMTNNWIVKIHKKMPERYWAPSYFGVLLSYRPIVICSFPLVII